MLKKILGNPFIKSIILVAFGTAGAQAIALIFSPIITRLYGPEAFGLLGTFTATLSLVAPITALTYPIAIVLPKSDHNAGGLVKLSLIIATTTSTVVFLTLIVAKTSLISILNLEKISNYIYLIPFAMFLSSLQEIMEQWLIRKKQFKVSARVAISQSFLLNSLKSGIGLIAPTAAALITLTALGHFLYASQLWLGSKKWGAHRDHISYPERKKANLKKLAYEYRDFPIFRTPQISINAISQSLPVLVLAAYFGPAVAGFYTLARTVMAAPAHLLGSSIGNVFFIRITETVNDGKNPKPFIQRATLLALLVATPPFSIVMIWGGPIFKFVFGSQWYDAGVYAQWIAIWLLFSLAARPVIAAIPVLELQGWFLQIELLFIFLKAAAIFFGAIIYGSALYAVSLYSLASALLYITLYFTVWLKIKAK